MDTLMQLVESEVKELLREEFNRGIAIGKVIGDHEIIERDTQVNDKVLIINKDSKYYGKILTVCTTDYGDIDVKEIVIDHERFHFNESEYVVINEKTEPKQEDNSGRILFNYYRTVKRPAKVGERILITNSWGSQDYENSDVGTVVAVLGTGGGVCVKEWDCYVSSDEYEVIIDE